MNNQNEIGVYNFKNDIFLKRAKLKSQASQKFFYGKDGLIEDFLGNIESNLAPIFLKIKNEQYLPDYISEDQVSLLHFLILLDMRNPNRKSHYEDTIRLFKEHLQKSDNPDLKTIKELQDVEKNDRSFLRMIVKSRNLIAICMDLNYKLLKNETIVPFITSDNPLVKYNQFLEKRSWRYGSHNGFGNLGAQWFMPINDEYVLVFFDSTIYKVGDKKEKIVSITDISSIDKLNILQCLNATQNVFFNHKIEEHYLEKIVKKSREYQKPNQSYSNVYKPVITKAEKEEIVFLGITDLKVNLELQKIKMHSKSKYLKLDDHIVQLRPRAKEIMDYQKQQAEQNYY